MTIDPRTCDPAKHWLIRANGGPPCMARYSPVDALDGKTE